MGVFQNGNGLLARDVGKAIQVLGEAQAAFQIVEKALHRHARASEARRAAQPFGVNPDGNVRGKIERRR